MAYVTFRHTAQGLQASVFGEVDHHSANALREAIDAQLLTQTPPQLVLALGGVTFMDSSGIGLIRGRQTVMRSLGGTLLIQDPPPQVTRILQLAGLSVHSTRNEVKHA